MYYRYNLDRGVIAHHLIKSKKTFFGLVASVVIIATGISPAFADSYSANFEQPTFNIADINGQDGWTNTGGYDAAVSNNTSGFNSFGQQSLRISDAKTSGAFGDQTFAKPLTDAVGETSATNGGFDPGTLQRRFEMKFSIASSNPSSVQNGMHMSVSPDRGDGSRMSYLRFEDQSDGIHVFFDDVTSQNTPNSDIFNESDITTLSRSAPHTIRLTLDTLDGPSNDVVKVYVDGHWVKTGTSWEDYYRYDSEASAEQSPRIVKTVLFRESGTANLTHAGHGFLVDNFSTSSGEIPATPTNKDQCKGDGYKSFTEPSFKNQGDCVSWVEHNVNHHGHGKPE